MKQSFLLTKTRKEVPVDEVANNAKLLIRAGYIHKTMAGVYSFLPLGLRCCNAIAKIIREEMNAIGGQEVLMNGLQNPEVWKETGRWQQDDDEVWFRSSFAGGGDVGFSWTHEEPATELMQHHIHSYRDLPLYLYQIQTKFRNEKRAKSGIMRTREFAMKDLYSFCIDEKQHQVFYEQCAAAYQRIFDRVGIGADTYRTFAGGGAFSEFSDEFQTVTEVGEDTIYLHRGKRIAVNEEVYNEKTLETLGLRKEELEKVAASEVGNIFTLGTRFSEALNVQYTDATGTRRPVFMGSYGIGPARILGVIAEKYGSENKLVLPTAIAPFAAHLLVIGESKELVADADALYGALTGRGIEVLYDDRTVSAGEKFADYDLIGIPIRIVISEKTREQGKVEYRNEQKDEEYMVDATVDAVITALSKTYA